MGKQKGVCPHCGKLLSSRREDIRAIENQALRLLLAGSTGAAAARAVGKSQSWILPLDGIVRAAQLIPKRKACREETTNTTMSKTYARAELFRRGLLPPPVSREDTITEIESITNDRTVPDD